MSNYELITLLQNAAKRYCYDAVDSIGRNEHMNALTPENQPTQEQVEAVVVDYINYIGRTAGLDVAMYTQDLR